MQATVYPYKLFEKTSQKKVANKMKIDTSSLRLKFKSGNTLYEYSFNY